MKPLVTIYYRVFPSLDQVILDRAVLGQISSVGDFTSKAKTKTVGEEKCYSLYLYTTDVHTVPIHIMVKCTYSILMVLKLYVNWLRLQKMKSEKPF